jgi:UDP-3-O-[3-hydroxymyristoyl] glucosamine N-acyltransferase
MIAGTTSIGKYCKLNMRSTVIDHLTVCDYSEIGAGAMLTKSVDIPGVYIGTPARRVKIGCMADVNETN